jgi:Flp pilus assembly protein TadG
MRRIKLGSFAKAEDGVAAIETAMVMPILLVLYIGMVDLTALVSVNRKMTQATSTVVDIVSQSRNNITKAEVTDAFKAVDLIMSAGGPSDSMIRIEGYRNNNGTMTKIWSEKKGSCASGANTSALANLTQNGNDIIVATVCSQYSPYLGTVFGKRVLNATSFSMSETIAVRPRATNQLTCWVSGNSGATCDAGS